MDNQYSKIHTELQQVAKKSPKFSLSKKNLWLINLLMQLAPSPTTLDGTLVERVPIPGHDGRTKIRLRLYKPISISAPSPVVIWLHGGGYVIGKREIGDGSCAQFVR